MFRTSRLNTFVVTLTALAAVLTLACHRAEAQVKPFKVTGGGPAPQGISLVPFTPAPHSAVGHATELGKYHGAGTFQILRFTSPTTADFSSARPFVFVAANGDRLAFTYGDVTNGAKQPGKVTLSVVGGTAKNPVFTARFVAEFNPVPAACTGRFKDVIGGSFIMVAVSGPFMLATPTTTTPFAYTWSGHGWLQFKE